MQYTTKTKFLKSSCDLLEKNFISSVVSYSNLQGANKTKSIHPFLNRTKATKILWLSGASKSPLPYLPHFIE